MKLFSFVFAGLLLVAVVSAGMAQEEAKMKKEDWQNEMNSLTGQQQGLQYQIDSLNKAINSLKDEGAGYDKETEQLWNEIYTAIGTDKAGVEEIKAKLTELEGRINEYAKMSDEALSQKIPELEALKSEVVAYRQDRRYALTEIFNKVNDLANRCDQLIQRGKNYQPPKPKHDTYVVVSGDYLWRISGKQDIYADPFQWMKIYSANRDQIRNPDLIFPRQSFLIPRAQEANEYWVARGDNLKLIAQKVYGSPASWVKIYNANKSIIGDDATRIYPHTILIVPKD
jgi:nucleoid-associated protein YgaU